MIHHKIFYNFIRKFDKIKFAAVIELQMNCIVKLTRVKPEKSNLEDELNRFKRTIFPEEAPGY